MLLSKKVPPHLLRRLLPAPRPARPAVKAGSTRRGNVVATIAGIAIASITIAGISTIALADTSAAAGPVQGQSSTQAPVATLQQIMLELIDPNVDALWNAVSTETGPDGVIETAPQTNQQWQQLERHALTLAEVANLLQILPRPVAQQNTSSHHTELQPAAIAELINANPAAFQAHAKALQQATLQLLQAIKARDIAAYEQAGGVIEHSCEGCHSQFWYPADLLPPAH